MKNSFSIIAFIIGFIVIKYFLPDIIPQNTNKMLMNVVEEMNQKLPYQLSDELQIEETSIGEPKELVYRYTFLKPWKRQSIFDRIHGKFEPFAKKHIKDNSEIKELLKRGVTLKYTYYDKNGEFISDFSIKPSDYGY